MNLKSIIDLPVTPVLDHIPVPVRFDVVAIPGKGRGVIAVEALSAGSVIIRDPVERYRCAEAEALRSHPIYYHLFVDPRAYGRAEQVDLLWAIGPISMVNHADRPNCTIKWTADGAGEWVTLVAINDIAAGTELLISYTNIDEYDVRSFT